MRGKQKTKLGRVVSNKMDKTAVVVVESYRHHPIYGKTVRRAVRYKAHDEKNECGIGDTVRLVETRPLSREKRWRVAEIVTRAEVMEVRPEELAVDLDELVPEPDETGAEDEPEAMGEEVPAG